MQPTPKGIFYAVPQILIFTTYLFRIATIDFQITAFFRYAGLALSITGIALIIVSIISLNKSLSPFPSPKDNSTLITTGVYKYIRHPIYKGILFITAGY